MRHKNVTKVSFDFFSTLWLYCRHHVIMVKQERKTYGKWYYERQTRFNYGGGE